MGNTWFKHYNNERDGHALRQLWDAGKFEAYSLFWIIKELICKWGDANGRLSTTWAILRRETGWNIQRLSRVLLEIAQTSGIQLEERTDQSLELFDPNWLKSQETRGAKNQQRDDEDQGEERGEKKEERYGSLESLFEKYPKRDGTNRKAVGMSRLAKIITSEESYREVETAIKNYAEYCKRNQMIGTPFVAQFASFFGKQSAWREWVETKKAKPSLQIKTGEEL